MADHLYVEPDELGAAVTSVAAADGALAAARASLDAARSRTAEVLGADGRAHEKFGTFVRQWRSEYELIADMLGAFTEILDRAASCYEELDASFAGAMAEAD